MAYLVSHPIQYQAPLLRRIAKEPDIELVVFFGSDFSLREYADSGFGVSFTWDVPLVDGYRHEFLPALHDNGTVSPLTPMSRGILGRLRGSEQGPAFDLLWVHGYASVNALHGMLAAKALGIPVLLRSDSTLTDRARGPLRLAAKELFFLGLRHLVSGILATGRLNAEYWRHYLGADVPLWLLPYAVDNNFFQQRTALARETRAELQAELGLEPHRPVILFASKLQERKRCADLLGAYLRVMAETQLKPYLVIVGDGEERAALELKTVASGAKGVRFCGFRNQSELPRYFDLASVFVLPSRHEPWGLVVNEAMNAALPVIVSQDVGCHPDLVTNGVEGFVFPTGDVDALTSALRRVLEDKVAAHEMGARAFKRVKECDFEADVRGLRAAVASLTHLIPERTLITREEESTATG